MPFEAATQPKGKFIPLEEENVYRQETNSIVTAPSGLSGKEVGYFDDTVNNKQNPQEYFGFSKVLNRTKDVALIPVKAVGATAVRIGTVLEAGPQQRMADAMRQGVEFDLNVINKKIRSGESVSDEERMAWRRNIADRNNIFSFLFRSPEEMATDKARSSDDKSAVISKANKLEQSSIDLRKRSDDFIEKNLARPSDDKTIAEQVFYDIAGVGTTIAASIGLSIITKNPVSAAAFFGQVQKESIYLEGSEEGIGPQKNRSVSNVAGAVEAGIEFVGVNYFFKLAENSKPLWATIKRMGEEALQEFSQSAAESTITQSQGYREVDIEGAAVDALYSGFLGAFGAGGGIAVESIYNRMKKTNDEQGLGFNDEEITVLSNKVHKNMDVMQDIIADEIQGQVSPLKDSPENDTKITRIIQDFQTGKPIDTSILSEDDQKILAESFVEGGLNVINAQEGRGMVPVPKRPQTLSEFLKEKGGLRVDTGEARRFTRKESPGLKGVANKNGTLGLDEAHQLAVEAGFLTENETDIQNLLDALESESMGVDRVRDQDISAMQERDQVLEYNEQVAQANTDLLSVSKQMKTIRSAFKEGARAGKKDVKQTQAVLINALNNTNMRAADKAKFIATIKNIQTADQLKKQAPDITQRVSDLLEADVKRNLREKIKKQISSAKKSKQVSADTIENIKRLEEKLKASGVLGSGFKDTSVADFKAGFDEANILMKEGKIKLLIAKEQKKERMAQRLEDLASETVPLNNTPMETASLGERLSVFDKMKNSLNEGLNKVQRLNINKNSMDVIFDIMDGNKDYKGANSTVFKKTMDRAFTRFLNLKENLTRDVKELSDQLKLDDRNFNRIGAYAALQQEGGREKLKKSGITDEELDNLELTDAEMQMYQLMRQKLDSMVPALKEVMLLAYNKEFKGVKDYFPFMTDFKAMSGVEIQNMFADEAFQIGDTLAEFSKKDVQKGFTKERTGGAQTIKIDAMNVFLSHVENAAYLIEMGQDIKELGELAISQDYQDIAGDFGQEIVVDWIDILARKGQAADKIDFLDTFRVNTGAAVLAFKLSSALIQPTALLDGAAFVGGTYVSRGTINVTQPEWRKFLYDNMPELRERVGDDPAYLDMGGRTVIEKAREVGFWALKKLDLMAASAVASGAYVKSVEQRGGIVDLTNPDPIAIEEAQLAMRRTQSSSFAKDAAPIIAQGKLTGNTSVDKLVLQFQSFMLNRWSLIQHDMLSAGVGRGKTAQAFNIATWLVLANMSEYFIRHYTKELIALLTGSEPPEDDKEISEIIIKQAIGNVPFISTVVNAGQYGSVPVPSVSMTEKIFEEVKYGNLSKSDEKKAKHYTQAAVLATGTILGIPGTLQANQLVKGAFDANKSEKKVSSP
jgi:hypothetical protein